MLCRSCHCQLTRGAPVCDRCGTPVPGAAPPLELVLPDERRIALTGQLDAGRAGTCAIVIDDPSVSRRHAMFVVDGPVATIEDLGSSHGTWLHGRRISGAEPLADGMRIRLGDSELRIERQQQAAAAGRTLIVPIGATGLLPVVAATSHGLRPRLRSGYALKRLEEGEGSERYVLSDMRGGGFARLDEDEARLLVLLDGRYELAELVAEAERLQGPGGPGLLARLVADLGARGMLADVDAATGETVKPHGWRRLVTPRRIDFGWAPGLVDRIYRRGGWILFTRLAFVLEALVAAAGLAAFVYLVAGPLRDAVRGRQARRAGRRGLRRGPLLRRLPARARPWPHDRVVRAARALGRAQGGGHLPVRVRRHVRGVVRAAAPAHRHLRRRARSATRSPRARHR